MKTFVSAMFVLVAAAGVAQAQRRPADVQCKATETQAECHARLQCKASEELKDCQKRLLGCKPEETLEACEQHAGQGQGQPAGQGGANGANGGQRGDNGNRGGERERGDDRGGDRGGERERGDDRGGDRGGDRDSGERRRGSDRGYREDNGGGGGRRRRAAGGGGQHGFQANKTFGLGLELGEPTGLTGKYFLSESGALDFGVGWIYDHYYYGDGFHLYGDYLWHPASLASTPSFELPFYIGVGARYWHFDYCDMKVCTFAGSALGVRVPIGLAFDFNNVPLDIFFQVVPVLDFLTGDYYDRYRDRAHFGVDVSLGIRFWFK